MKNQTNSLTDEDIAWICEKTDGYSGSDMDGLCREAALGPIRSITDILNVSTSDVRPVLRSDFEEALTQVRASVSNKDLELYLEWNESYGSLGVKKPWIQFYKTRLNYKKQFISNFILMVGGNKVYFHI